MFMLAGLARCDITPAEPIWLAGWASRTKPSQGVSHRLFVKALALRHGEDEPCVWVTCDLLGLSRSMTADIARRVQRRFGVSRQRLVLNASHNHSGPVTGDVLRLYFDLSPRHEAVINRYTRWMLQRVVETVGRALSDLSPAKLSFGQGLAGFAVNRRRARAGGRGLTTVTDPDVPVLAIRSRRGTLRAVVFGYACHTTCVSDGTINGDYAGFAQTELENAHPGALALFVQGCGGDANPLPRHQPGLGEMYGRVLAQAVRQVLETPMNPVAGPLRVAFDEVTLPFEKPPTVQELRSLLPGADALNRRAIRYQLSLLSGRRDRRWRALPYPVHVWRFGPQARDLKIIHLSSEAVADYALRFKRAFGPDDTWVSAYNDDYWCYIPSRRVWEEGGYEGTTGMLECGLPGPFAPCVEDLIAAKVEDLMSDADARPRPYPRPSRHL